MRHGESKCLMVLMSSRCFTRVLLMVSLWLMRGEMWMLQMDDGGKQELEITAIIVADRTDIARAVLQACHRHRGD